MHVLLVGAVKGIHAAVSHAAAAAVGTVSVLTLAQLADATAKCQLEEMDGRDDVPVDFESFARSARPHLKIMVRPILARVAPDQVEDVVQVTLVVVWRHWEELNKPYRYAVVIARRLAARYAYEQYEHRKRTARLAAAQEDLPAGRAARETDAVPLKVDLDRAISRLPERQRAVLQMHLEDMSYSEIAQLLNISPGTVANHIRQVRAKLRDLLGERPGDHHD
jgi:RNA polymerase sigma factor (sigma-70 family)